MSTNDPLDDYVKELERELRDVPRARRRELVDDLRTHVTEAAPATEAELRTLLERLGSPGEIAKAEIEPDDAGPRRRGFGLEIAALVLLAIGFFIVPFIGWFVGVALLWGSSAWTTREKLLGTFVFPGGFVFPFYLVLAGPFTNTRTCGSGTVNGRPTAEVCTSTGPDGLEQVLIAAGLLIMLLGSIATIAFLAGRMRRGVRA